MARFYSEKERRLHAVLEAVPNGIIFVDQAGKIVLCNSEAERMFGYDPGELTHQNVEVLVPLASRGVHPGLRRGFHEAPAKRKMGAGRDLAGLKKDGTEFPVEIGLNPVHGADGDFVLASVVDITERKRQEQQLYHVLQEVQRRNEEMEQFVYTISHDLRSPLVTMMGLVAFLREDIAEGNFSEVDDALDRIERANGRMQQLIDDLLQLSRAGRLELKLEPVDLNQLLGAIADAVGKMAEERGARIQVAPGLPVITGDGGRLYQVFENLLINAIKYGTGGEKPEVRVFWEDGGEEVRVCVADNGPGIPEEDQRKIFGLFQRLASDQEGTGVGLAIVTRIAELHGGRVWVVSKPGEGAAFWVALPKVQPRKEDE